MSNIQPYKGEIPPLTGIRGLAAVWVVLYHYRFAIEAYAPEATFLHQFIYSGYLGVDLFAILSGFIISYTYSNRLSKFNLEDSIYFIWLRFVRTYPLHLFVLFLFVLQFTASRGIDSLAVLPYDSSFIRQLFLINSLGLETEWRWNAPSWSLSAEWICYLLFPLYSILLNKLRTGRTHLALIIATVTITSLLMWFLDIPASTVFWNMAL